MGTCEPEMQKMGETVPGGHFENGNEPIFCRFPLFFLNSTGDYCWSRELMADPKFSKSNLGLDILGLWVGYYVIHRHVTIRGLGALGSGSTRY